MLNKYVIDSHVTKCSRSGKNKAKKKKKKLSHTPKTVSHDFIDAVFFFAMISFVYLFYGHICFHLFIIYDSLFHLLLLFFYWVIKFVIFSNFYESDDSLFKSFEQLSPPILTH